MKWDIKLTIVLFLGYVSYCIYYFGGKPFSDSGNKPFSAIGWMIFTFYSILLIGLTMMILIDRFPDARGKIRFYCGIIIIVALGIRACAGVL